MARGQKVPVKTISLTGDHVHMPADLLTPDWENCADTARYDRKIEADGKTKVAKYTVHAELADFLIGRDQAIETVPDQPAEATDGEDDKD